MLKVIWMFRSPEKPSQQQQKWQLNDQFLSHSPTFFTQYNLQIIKFEFRTFFFFFSSFLPLDKTKFKRQRKKNETENDSIRLNFELATLHLIYWKLSGMKNDEKDVCFSSWVRRRDFCLVISFYTDFMAKRICLWEKADGNEITTDSQFATKLRDVGGNETVRLNASNKVRERERAIGVDNLIA